MLTLIVHINFHSCHRLRKYFYNENFQIHGISLASSVLSVVVQAVKPATNWLAKGTKSHHNNYIILIYHVCMNQQFKLTSYTSYRDPTTHVRKGDIGADSWFCKLSSHVIICIGLYWSMSGHVMVRKTKKML